MSGVDLSLLIGALVCAGISWRNPRGLMWVGFGAMSYVGATIAWRMNLPQPEVVTAIGDVIVCLAVYFLGRYQWEMHLWRLFQVSVAASIIYLAGTIGIISRIDHEAYSIILEAINWMALILIGGTSVLQGAGERHVYAHRPWNRVRRVARALHRERKTDSFLKAGH